MSSQTLLEIGTILEQLATGDLTEEVAARRLGWALTGQAPTCQECSFFNSNVCELPGMPVRRENPHSIACNSFHKFDPRDVALPVEPAHTNGCLFK